MLRSIGFDAANNVLEVEFRDLSVYQYVDVPEREATGLLAAASKGKYFTSQIKGRYRTHKVR